MKQLPIALIFTGLIFTGLIGLGIFSAKAAAQDSKPPADAGKPAADSAPPPADNKTTLYSGIYAFLKEGEFVQVTVEDGARVTGFVSRFGNGESDKGEFLDQFFKSGKLEGNKLTFTTEMVHGIAFDFSGAIERGEGKNSGDDAYFVLKGTLTENISDANKKTTSHARDVALKSFPKDAAPAPEVRK